MAVAAVSAGLRHLRLVTGFTRPRLQDWPALYSTDVGVQPPKKPLSAYFIFQSDKMAGLKASQEKPVKASEVVKTLGSMWRNLSEQEREKFKADASEKKKEYLAEMSKYESLLSPKERYELQAKRENKRLEMLQKKNLLKRAYMAYDMPAKPRSAYQLFTAEHFPLVSQDSGLAKDVLIDLAQKWTDMSAEDKQKYVATANELKDKYTTSMEEWKSRMIAEGKEKLLHDLMSRRVTKDMVLSKNVDEGVMRDVTAAVGEVVKKQSVAREPFASATPLHMFVLKKMLAMTNDVKCRPEIIRSIAEDWLALSDEKKEMYNERAKMEQSKHTKLMARKSRRAASLASASKKQRKPTNGLEKSSEDSIPVVEHDDAEMMNERSATSSNAANAAKTSQRRRRQRKPADSKTTSDGSDSD